MCRLYLSLIAKTNYNERYKFERKVVTGVSNVSATNEKESKELIKLLKEQLTLMNQQNQELSKKLDQSLKHNEALTQQLQYLTKQLFGSKTEKSKYNGPEGQGSLFDDDLSFIDSEHTEEQSEEIITYTVKRKATRKKEMIHYAMT